jgi:5-carboxymethyl-2-hydroxymuconate isomerase
MSIDLGTYQAQIDNLARQFVDMLVHAAIATGSDPDDLRETGNAIITAFAAALDAEKAKRFAAVKP